MLRRKKIIEFKLIHYAQIRIIYNLNRLYISFQISRRNYQQGIVINLQKTLCPRHACKIHSTLNILPQLIFVHCIVVVINVQLICLLPQCCFTFSLDTYPNDRLQLADFFALVRVQIYKLYFLSLLFFFKYYYSINQNYNSQHEHKSVGISTYILMKK